MVKFVFKFTTNALRKKSIDVARKRYNTAARKLQKEAEAASSAFEREALLRSSEQLRERAAMLRGLKPSATRQSAIKTLIKDSDMFLQSSLSSDWMRGEALGNLRLSGTSAGHRFYSLTEPLWSGAPKGRRLDAIRKAVAKNPDIVKKYGKRPNTSQLIEIIESATGTKIDVDEESIGGTDKSLWLRMKSYVISKFG